MNPIRRLMRPLIQFREFQAVLAGFRRLSEEPLREAGIARDDIVRRAFEEAERRADAFVASRPRTAAARRTSEPAPAPQTSRHAEAGVRASMQQPRFGRSSISAVHGANVEILQMQDPKWVTRPMPGLLCLCHPDSHGRRQRP